MRGLRGVVGLYNSTPPLVIFSFISFISLEIVTNVTNVTHVTRVTHVTHVTRGFLVLSPPNLFFIYSRVTRVTPHPSLKKPLTETKKGASPGAKNSKKFNTG
jgi:hypothetical protein